MAKNPNPQPLIFDPNKLELWGVYQPKNKVPFKVYRGRGPALAAISNGFRIRDFILYRLKDGEWEEVDRVENGKVDTCIHMNGDTTGWATYAKWLGLKTDRPRRLALCYECKYGRPTPHWAMPKP